MLPGTLSASRLRRKSQARPDNQQRARIHASIPLHLGVTKLAQVARPGREEKRAEKRRAGKTNRTEQGRAEQITADADLAAAASLSVMDYLGEIDWNEYPQAKEWYQRIKSRPSFRPLLADRIRNLPPVAHYADLDF